MIHYWWYATLEPTFEPADPAPDFVWLNIWANSETADKKLHKTTLIIVVEDKFTCLPDSSGAGFQELQLEDNGAGDGIRTRTNSLEGYCASR